MKHIYILIFEDVILSSAAGPLDIFTRTNDLLVAAGREPAFRVQLVSQKARNIHLDSPTQFICQLSIDDLPARSSGHTTPLVLVPAFTGGWDRVHEKNRTTVEWLAQHYAAGSEIASLCVGAYFLAQAGILDGKPCTTHWRAVDDLQQRFPEVQVRGDEVVTDQDGVYTGGGAFSSLNLVLYLVEKFCGHEMGIRVSKQFSIHRDHISQAHFAMFNGLSQHGDPAVAEAQSFIEQRFNQDLTVEQVAQHVNMSKRNFIRRFKQATHLTPLEYTQKVKIENAKRGLENSSKGIQELMYEVGYNDIKTFRDMFKRQTGVTPQDYRRKYGLNARATD
ncbi:MAG TPA: helix-turn-helix domain-containing protein [Xanthomonadales bacterium]|nr:helix-turn-helix domain-containing protein [Xanthomonadales bacterium]